MSNKQPFQAGSDRDDERKQHELREKQNPGQDPSKKDPFRHDPQKTPSKDRPQQR